MTGTAPRLPRVAALLATVLCIHDLEEALTFGWYRERSASLAASLLGRPISMPTASTFHAMLAGVTITGVAVAWWAGTGGASAAKRRALGLFAGLLLLNVFVPHLPAAIAMGGYAPGVLTAIGINLPLAIFCLRRLCARGV